MTEQASQIAPKRALLTTRATRWATRQAGRGEAISDTASVLGCGWHTVNTSVQRWGSALLDVDTERISAVSALGLDETLMWRRGRFGAKAWSTSIVDVKRGQLLDIVAGRTAKAPTRWLLAQPPDWLAGIVWATLDLSGPYRAAFEVALPHAAQVADPFHVVKLANTALDETRRRVQNQTLSHRGHKHDPLYRLANCWFPGTNASPVPAKRNCWARSKPATPTARFATPGTPTKPCAAATASTTPSWAPRLLSSSPKSSVTRACRRRSTD